MASITALPFVCVTWEDAWGDITETITTVDAHVRHKPATYKTYGFLLYENEKGVSLTNEECVDDESLRGRNFINRSLIRSVVHLRLVKPRPKRPQTNPDASG